MGRGARSTPPLGLVMGDVDLVRTLGMAGIPVAFFGQPGASARFSRHVRAVLPWIDHWERPEELVAALVRFGRAQAEPPILYPQTDAALLLTSRHRDELGRVFRFVLADAELVEELVDKGRFQALGELRGLPIPAAHRIRPEPGQPLPDLDLAFPVIVKPVFRALGWGSLGAEAKALHIAGREDWVAAWPRLAGVDCELLVQDVVPGPESTVESYHAYVDAGGAIVAEFTGRKIRTFPAQYGYSTAVEVTDLPDVAALGRDVVTRIGLRGVAKADFKRDPAGRLHLLEVNPRFTLWHHPAAIAGVNVPALVHADLTGRPRPAGRHATRAVAWCTPLSDLRAAHAQGVSALSWLRWVRRCRAVSGLSADDPLPFLRGSLWHATSSRLPRRLPSRVTARVAAS